MLAARGESLRRVSAPPETQNRAEQVKASSGTGSNSSLRN
jgi:hypothetical protein